MSPAGKLILLHFSLESLDFCPFFSFLESPQDAIPEQIKTKRRSILKRHRIRVIENASVSLLQRVVSPKQICFTCLEFCYLYIRVRVA